MILDGLGVRLLWPTGPGWYTEDDFQVDPRLGLAVVARGTGAIGGQGKPAGKLAVWSVAGELAASGRPGTAEALIRKGFSRANEAIARLSASWHVGLGKPIATAAALVLDGPAVIVAHVGDCRVSRVHPGGLEPLTRDHTIGAEWPQEQVIPQIARICTRTLGGGGEPEIRRHPARPGEVFLIATSRLHEALSEGEISAALAGIHSGEPDPVLAVESLTRALRAREPDHGRHTFAVARMGDGPLRAPTRGSSSAPGLGWLHAPGAPLEDPPPRWAPGATGEGPGPEWFSEVFAGVMGNSADD